MKYQKRTVFRKAPLALACAAVTLVSGYVTAQDTPVLEEIMVTASKRSESLQDVAMSITALGGEDLERLGATDLLGFAVRVPNLAMAYEADGRFDSSSPSMRGVFGRNTTGFYIDDTPVNASILPRVMDVARVEVLRGPQGSLYGARSMGGTIRMITKQPDLQESAGAIHVTGSTVEEGEQNYAVDGSFNLPVIEDVFALRVSGYYGSNSGIYDRTYQSSWVEAGSGTVRQNTAPAFKKQENVDDETFWGGQIIGLWQITDNLSFTPKLMGQSVDADGLPFADIDPDNTNTPRFFNTQEPGTDDWYIASGTFNWEIDAGTIVSSTSWYERETDEAEEEATFLHWLFNNVIEIPIDPIESQISTIEQYETFTQEVRFTSNFDGPWQLIAGVYYADSTWDHEYPPALQVGLNDAVNDFVGAPINIAPGDLIFSTKTITDTKELAAYGELTYNFDERWAVTAGGRYYKTTVDVKSQSDGFANDGPSSYADEQEETGFNPSFLVEAVINDEMNVYASAAKGFRVGGVNGNLPQGLCGPEIDALNINPDQTRTYDSDELWSYELGVKSTLADNRVTLNAAVYYIDWTDVQQFNRLACGFQYTANAGEAESKGFEVEMAAAITDGLTATVGVGYTDAEITDSGGIGGVSDGDKVQGVPDWTASGSLEYMFPMGNQWDGMVRADANYYGESFSSNNESSSVNQRQRDAWSAVNFRAGMINETWDLVLFVDNATDERANLADSRSIAAETPGRQRLVTNRPRTMGVEARMRF